MNGRLDIFAVYGPTSKRFLISKFSKQGQTAIKKYLKMFRAGLVEKEKERLGIKQEGAQKPTSQASSKPRLVMKATRKSPPKPGETRVRHDPNKYMPDHRLHLPPMLVVDEEAIIHLWSELSAEDREMCEDYCTLLSGRELTHAVTDAEIDGMIDEMNRKDLLRVLMGSKGNGAKVMMEEMSVKEPEEYQHTEITIKKLLQKLTTDYFGRYDFRELQNVILEDRRIRLNAWAAKILDIPVQKIPINKHVNPKATLKEKADPKNLNYTLTRLQPLPMITKKVNLAAVPTDFPVSIIDKKKYMANEAALVRQKLLHRHAFKFTPLEPDGIANAPWSTVFLMKNINEGRNGDWNNYAGLKGNAVESYVLTKSRFDVK